MYNQYTSFSDEACPQTSSGGKTFGSSCESLCHCKDSSEQCNETTGECTVSGCGDRWMGQGCQYRNISLSFILYGLYGLRGLDTLETFESF